MIRLMFALGLTLACAGGCTALGYGLAQTSNEKVSAEYKPKKVTTLVLVESYDDPEGVSLNVAAVSTYVVDDLRRYNAVPIADTKPLEQLRTNNPADFKQKTIRDLGRMVGASQVIYINLEHTDVSQTPGSEIWRGTGRALVKIVDTESGATLWPTESEKGYPVDATTALINEDMSQLQTETQVRSSLEQELSAKIAELFYDTPLSESHSYHVDNTLTK